MAMKKSTMWQFAFMLALILLFDWLEGRRVR
jgi:hypothetical protein